MGEADGNGNKRKARLGVDDPSFTNIYDKQPSTERPLRSGRSVEEEGKKKGKKIHQKRWMKSHQTYSEEKTHTAMHALFHRARPRTCCQATTYQWLPACFRLENC